MENWYVNVSGQQVGPMGWGQVVEMAKSGRMGPDDGIYNPTTQQWTPAGQFPGIQFGRTMPSAASSGDPLMRAVIPIGQSGLAITASYLGLFSMVCIPAPIAIIVGILAVNDIKKNPGKHGLWRAWFGIICGILGTIGLIWVLTQMNRGPAPEQL